MKWLIECERMRWNVEQFNSITKYDYFNRNRDNEFFFCQITVWDLLYLVRKASIISFFYWTYCRGFFIQLSNFQLLLKNLGRVELLTTRINTKYKRFERATKIKLFFPSHNVKHVMSAKQKFSRKKRPSHTATI